uniref:Uncharacterized protein n=1 Tax=Meleagris gallopavo TaxID=9103 RepID=A0A803Y1L9_MELGA
MTNVYLLAGILVFGFLFIYCAYLEMPGLKIKPLSVKKGAWEYSEGFADKHCSPCGSDSILICTRVLHPVYEMKPKASDQRLLDKQPLLEMLLNGGVCKFRLWTRCGKIQGIILFSGSLSSPKPKSRLGSALPCSSGCAVA